MIGPYPIQGPTTPEVISGGIDACCTTCINASLEGVCKPLESNVPHPRARRMPWLACLLCGVIGFLVGLWAAASGSGNPYWRAVKGYLDVHLFYRREAVLVSRIADAAGVPLVLTSEAELAAISAVAASMATAVVRAARRNYDLR